MAVKVEKLTGIDKAALLLLSLGENRAGEILNRLDDKEVQLLGQKISKVEIVPTKQMAAILEEFCRMIEAPEALVVKGDHFFKNTISPTMDSRRQEELMDKLDLEQSPEFFLKIKKLDYLTVASFLRNEHPQTVALVLCPSRRTAAPGRTRRTQHFDFNGQSRPTNAWAICGFWRGLLLGRKPAR